MLTDKQLKPFEWLFKKTSRRTILAINAPAGTGKTFFIRQVFSKYSNTLNMYLSFVSKVVDDGKASFSDETICSTFHGLARSKMDFEIDNNRPEHIDILDWAKIKRFARSEKTNFEKEFKKNKKCLNYFEEAMAQKIPVTHDILLKILHIKLERKLVKISTDILVLDECQDVSIVMLKIFLLIESRYKIIAGDINQHIYSFAGAVNAFKLTRNKTYTFSKSYRFNEHMNRRISSFVKKHLE